MSVFVAEVCVDYEGCEVIGVFSTPELAKESCKGHAGDYWVVSEYCVDSAEAKPYEIKHWNREWVRSER